MKRKRNMWQSRNGDGRRAVVLFAILVAAVIVLAFVTTLNRLDVRAVHDDQPPGTTGLARPHPPLQRAPGQPAQ